MDKDNELSIITEALEIEESNERKILRKAVNDQNISSQVLKATFNNWQSTVEVKNKYQKMLDSRISREFDDGLLY